MAINNLTKFLHGLYFAKVPVMIYGEPGVGKTSQVKYLGEEILGVKTVCRSGNKSDPTDFSGIPYLVDVSDEGDGVVKTRSHKEVRYSMPTYVKELNENPNGILFFDELPTCPVQIQVALLSIIQDCEFGEFKIPESTFRVAAGNYANCLGNGQLSLAMLNRMVQLHYVANPEMWCEGIVSGFQNYDKAIINSEEDQYKKKVQYAILVSKFIKENPQYLEVVPEDPDSEEDMAFPSPRSWDNVIKILTVLDQNEDDYLREIINGLIGKGVGGLFFRFFKDNNKFTIDLTSYVGQEDKFVIPNPDAHDECHQIISAGAFYFKDDPQRFLKLWERIVNTFHNKDQKYGKYTGYDNFIMKYLVNSIQIMIKAGMTGQKLRDISQEIDDWNELTSLSSDVSQYMQ